MRGALARLAKKGEDQAAEPPAPDQVLWQLEQFTRRVVKKYGSGSTTAARARMELSLQLGSMQRWDDARELRQECFDCFRNGGGEEDPETLQTELSLAVALAHTGRWSDADAHLQHAAASSALHLGPDHEVTRLARSRLDEFRRGRPDPGW